MTSNAAEQNHQTTEELEDEGDFVLAQRLVTEDFLSGLWSEDEDARIEAAHTVATQLMDHFQDPSNSSLTLSQATFHLEGILRIAMTAPFDNIRTILINLMSSLKDMGVAVPRPLNDSPSWFIPPDRLKPIDGPDEDVRKVLELSYLSKGRISNLFRIMCFFPTYAKIYEELYQFAMFGSGPLPLFWRNYIALMAASRHNCRYLIVQQEVMFYSNGGDPIWLKGVSWAPAKLQKLSLLNALLAHQPWLINKGHLEALVAENWQISEIMQAVLIMVTFHTLSGFAWGVGVVPEIDRESGVLERVDEAPLFSPGSPAEGLDPVQDVQQKTSELLMKLREIRLARLEDEDSDGSVRSRDHVYDDPRQHQQFFEESENNAYSPSFDNNRKKIIEYRKYWGGVDMKHVDFNVKSNTYKVFRLQDYSWEDHGFPLLNRYYPGAAELLDRSFNETYEMTEYMLFNNKDIDTSPFRQAIWYYVLRLKGMSHDDYAYQQVNAVLNVQLKTYVKKLACFPEMIVRQDYVKFGVSLFDSEKIHVNLLALEARRQAEMLYVLNALMKYKGE